MSKPMMDLDRAVGILRSTCDYLFDIGTRISIGRTDGREIREALQVVLERADPQERVSESGAGCRAAPVCDAAVHRQCNQAECEDYDPVSPEPEGELRAVLAEEALYDDLVEIQRIVGNWNWCSECHEGQDDIERIVAAALKRIDGAEPAEPAERVHSPRCPDCGYERVDKYKVDMPWRDISNYPCTECGHVGLVWGKTRVVEGESRPEPITEIPNQARRKIYEATESTSGIVVQATGEYEKATPLVEYEGMSDRAAAHIAANRGEWWNVSKLILSAIHRIEKRLDALEKNDE